MIIIGTNHVELYLTNYTRRRTKSARNIETEQRYLNTLVRECNKDVCGEFQENKDTLPQGRVSSLFTVVKWKHDAISLSLFYLCILYTLFRLH